MPIQQASYRGVRFDVLSVDDSFDRAIVEHGYPFVNGADLEDMGINSPVVKLQAIFYGAGYYTRFKKFLEVLQKSGGDVLMHPVRGRMQDMICYSASFRHEADNVDYVALDLSFKQATPMKPIFSFAAHYLSILDNLLNQLEDAIDTTMLFFGDMMSVVSAVYDAKSRLLGAWGALTGCAQHIMSLVEGGNSLFRLPSSVTASTFGAHSQHVMTQITQAVVSHLQAQAALDDIAILSRFDEVERIGKQVYAIPNAVAQGKTPQGYHSLARQKALTSLLSERDVQPIRVVFHAIGALAINQVAVMLLEKHSEELTPREIEQMNAKVRAHLAIALSRVREYVHQVEQVALVDAPNTALYSRSHQLQESLRNAAHRTQQLAIAMINQKPPLTVRESPLSGTLHQVAHYFYHDYRRADELLRLNPHIDHPNFIARGVLINGYAK
ncbi:DNA circularization protein [Pasteurellaceae bacterium HPA106]|nr:DNA circularization protein [Spirabiliibacterium pneumoniae]